MSEGGSSSLSAGRLAGMLCDADRFAVVDVETTGLYNVDRVVEIAIVTLDSTGRVIDEWSTLVDPCRDVGPTSIHGITATDVHGAPTFEEIAGDVALRLHGACLVAHNLHCFDARMLRNEFERLRPAELDVGHGVDTLTLVGAKLPVACQSYGIVLEDWHSALADARATAQLLVAVGSSCTETTRSARAFSVRPSVATVRCRTTALVVAELSWFVSVLRTLPFDDVPPNEQPYLDLLERVLADWKITKAERSALDNLACELGLDDRARTDAHRHLVAAVTDRALDDGVVTADELTELLVMATLLQVEHDRVVSRTAHARQSSSRLSLDPGLRVCFTGEPVIDGDEIFRTEMEARACQLGLVPVPSVNKATDLLVAADIATRSGKADKARRTGVPIASAYEFLSLSAGEEITVVRATVRERKVEICHQCGAAIVLEIGQARRPTPLCGECRPSIEMKRPAASTARTGNPATETLVCEQCASSWQRVTSRGRKPKLCSTCRSSTATQTVPSNPWGPPDPAMSSQSPGAWAPPDIGSQAIVN